MNSKKLINKKNQINKKHLLFALASFGVLAVTAASISIPLATSKTNGFNSNDISFAGDQFSTSNQNLDKNQFAADVKPLVPLEFNTYMPLVSTKSGPIGFFKSEIRALDWFGALRWSLDTTNLVAGTAAQYPEWISRPFVNWAYNYADDVLWLLTTAIPGKTKQQFVSIDGKNGDIIKRVDLPNILGSQYRLFYFIQILTSGNIISYGAGNAFTVGEGREIYEYNPKLDRMRTITSNIPNNIVNAAPGQGEVRLYNIIPIVTDRNIMVFQRVVDSTVSFALVDDNFSLVYTSSTNKWSQLITPLGNDVKRWTNFTDKTFYKLLDGRIVTVIFNKLLIIDDIKILDGEDFLTIHTFDNPPRSFSFDTNEHMFLTFLNKTEIIKLILPKRDSTLDPIISNYYNLNDSVFPGIKNNASKFILYNVNGYAGQIMLLKPIERLNPNRNNPFNPTQAEIESNQYGLAAAIVNNVSSQEYGDSKGLLNTKDAFEFSADFDILQTVLTTKLPSEITINDITLQNNSTFTKNISSNDSGQLLYPTFLKKDINDELGTFTIEVNLDQIPWFASALPVNFIPLKVTKVFSTIDKIAARVTWKDVNFDYNFKNTLPSKIDGVDLKRFDPFLINLSSQRIIDNNTQEQIYPKKEYRVTSANDSTGIVTIQCTYTYMPLGVATLGSNAKTFTTDQNFTVFKSGDTRSFNWLLSNAQNNNDIKTIPSLKMLSESNLLPSSIDASDPSKFLPFVNTNTSTGYPLSKMTFSLVTDDQKGELRITAVLPASYNGQIETFNQTYIGFNKLSDYSFNYKKASNLTQISGSGIAVDNTSPTHEYNKMLPTQITEEMIFLDFVNYSGYNNLDLKVILQPNNNLGELNILFELDSDYPQELGNGLNTFTLENGKYVSNIKLGGFLNQTDYIKSYSLTFKDDKDKSLNQVKNIEVSVILNSISSTEGLLIDGVRYKSLEQFAELFISFKGSNLQTINASNVKVYPNNSSGTLTFELVFLPSQTGFSSNLIFSQIFTGFIQGVEKPTNDSFIFKNQDNLDANLLTKLPSTIKNELTNNPLLVKDYFVNIILGQFTSLILNPNAFKLIIDANDVFGSLTITIVFDKTMVSDPVTLTTYAIAYNGFQKVN